MSEVDGLAFETDDRREGSNLERSDEGHHIGRAVSEVINLFAVTVDRDAQAEQSRRPVGREVVPIEMGKTKSGDVGQANTSAFNALGKSAWADASVDEHYASGRANDCCVSGRTAG